MPVAADTTDVRRGAFPHRVVSLVTYCVRLAVGILINWKPYNAGNNQPKREVAPSGRDTSTYPPEKQERHNMQKSARVLSGCRRSSLPPAAVWCARGERRFPPARYVPKQVMLTHHSLVGAGALGLRWVSRLRAGAGWAAAVGLLSRQTCSQPHADGPRSVRRDHARTRRNTCMHTL